MFRSSLLAFGLVCFAACSTPEETPGQDVEADPLDDVQSSKGDTSDGNGQGSDVVLDAGATDADAPDGGSVADSLGPDSQEPDTQLEDAEDTEEDIDWSELLDPPDVDEPDSKPSPTGPVGDLYAHTSDTLYRLDLKASAFVKIGKFVFNKNKGSVTDIALDDTGKLYAVTYTDLFQCTLDKAACIWLAKLPTTPDGYNGLTFVPEGVLDPVKPTLIGISEDGSWNQLTLTGTTVQTKKLGTYGGGWLSSGDSFSVEGIGTYATIKGKGTSDSLALIDPKNGQMLSIIGETGAEKLFGLAWWENVFYAFSSNGKVYTLDVQTGKASVLSGITAPIGVKWWGAGVSTRAAGPKK